ncbi:MAG: hypothetical protein EOP39_31825 [Rubrivivax sp.]|nr:MAG: hypothetical protein EOP39_31825 [Rubrivivax sp.]
MSSLPPSPAVVPWACPLCGQANLCAIEAARLTGQAPAECWCMQVEFDTSALTSLPVESRGLACICQRCATQQP